MKVTFEKPDMAVGTTKLAQAEGRSVLICRTEQGYIAFSAICPHQSLTMDGARLRGGMVWCPHHGARFKLETGESTTPLTRFPLARYACEERDGVLEIELPELAGGTAPCITIPS